MTTKPLRRVDWFWLAAGALMTILVTQQFALAMANRRLRDQIVAAAAEVVQPGDQMGRLTGFSLSGDRVSETVYDPSNRSLVIGISPFCGVCVSNVPAWRRLMDAAAVHGVRVLWVSRDLPEATADFVLSQVQDPAATVLADPTYPTFRQMKLRAVPQTVLVGFDGIVAGVWPGVIDAIAEENIVSAMRKLVSPGQRN